MTATTAPASAPAAGSPAPARPAQPGVRVTFPHTVRAEWIKLWSLRSTYWTLAVTLLLFVGGSALSAVSIAQVPELVGDAAAGSVPIVQQVLMPGLLLGQLPLLVLAALTVTGEYATGAARSSFAAVPARVPVLLAKAVVVAVVAALTTAVGVAVAVLVAGGIADVTTPDWGAPYVVHVVLGVLLYAVGAALLGLAVGAVLRSSAAAITSVIGLVLIVENVLTMLPWEPLEWVRPLLPSRAGMTITQTPEQAAAAADMGLAFAPSPWGGYAILLGWVVLLGTVAAVRLRTRDA